QVAPGADKFPNFSRKVLAPDLASQAAPEGGGDGVPGRHGLVLGQGAVGTEEGEREGEALAALPHLIAAVDVEDPDLLQRPAPLPPPAPRSARTPAGPGSPGRRCCRCAAPP